MPLAWELPYAAGMALKRKKKKKKKKDDATPLAWFRALSPLRSKLGSWGAVKIL